MIFNSDGGRVDIPFESDDDIVADHTFSIVVYEIRIVVDVVIDNAVSDSEVVVDPIYL